MYTLEECHGENPDIPYERGKRWAGNGVERDRKEAI
jgi:hypothetical protein